MRELGGRGGGDTALSWLSYWFSASFFFCAHHIHPLVRKTQTHKKKRHHKSTSDATHLAMSIPTIPHGLHDTCYHTAANTASQCTTPTTSHQRASVAVLDWGVGGGCNTLAVDSGDTDLSRAPSPSWSIVSGLSDDSADDGARVHDMDMGRGSEEEAEVEQTGVPQEIGLVAVGGRRNGPANTTTPTSGCVRRLDDTPSLSGQPHASHVFTATGGGGALLPSYRTSLWCVQSGATGGSGWASRPLNCHQGHSTHSHLSPTAPAYQPWPPAPPREPYITRAWDWTYHGSMHSQQQQQQPTWSPVTTWPGGGSVGNGPCGAAVPPPPPYPPRASPLYPRLSPTAREFQPRPSAMEASILRMCDPELADDAHLHQGIQGQGNLQSSAQALQLPPVPPLFYVGTRTVVTLLPRQWCLGTWQHPCSSFASAVRRAAGSRAVIRRPSVQPEVAVSVSVLAVVSSARVTDARRSRCGPGRH